jgi:predicted ATPase
MLLVLDNFEHLISEANQLSDLLRLAPKLKIVVTSRTRLNLQQEWLMEVQGLAVPANAQAVLNADIEYSAISLFVRQARRIRSGFTLESDELPHVVRICQLVEGVPLCIELAASWLRVLTCREIAAEIAEGLDFLTSTLQNVPERHRSLRAVFDHSWNLLSNNEQTAIRQLSIFRGGFQRAAASKVVGASLPMLAGLVDKSLLRRNAVGRYEVHDLLRQYAEEKLRANADEYIQMGNTHCSYYADIMVQHEAQLKSNDVSVAITELNAERENVRAAWNWAMSQRRIDELNMFMSCL